MKNEINERQENIEICESAEKAKTGKKAKERIREFSGKMKNFMLRLRDKVDARAVAAACAVLLVGCAVLLNFVLFREGDAAKEKEPLEMAIDLEGLSDEDLSDGKTDVSADVDGDADADYFASVSLSREQTRDEAMEVLLELTENGEAEQSAKDAAIADINRIALDIEKEGDIEAMVVAKGFERCVAVVNGDKASVIVSCDTLTPGETAQISEIVYEAAGIVPANLKIIEKKANG